MLISSHALSRSDYGRTARAPLAAPRYAPPRSPAAASGEPGRSPTGFSSGWASNPGATSAGASTLNLTCSSAKTPGRRLVSILRESSRPPIDAAQDCGLRRKPARQPLIVHEEGPFHRYTILAFLPGLPVALHGVGSDARRCWRRRWRCAYVANLPQANA